MRVILFRSSKIKLLIFSILIFLSFTIYQSVNQMRSFRTSLSNLSINDYLKSNRNSTEMLLNAQELEYNKNLDANYNNDDPISNPRSTPKSQVQDSNDIGIPNKESLGIEDDEISTGALVHNSNVEHDKDSLRNSIGQEGYDDDEQSQSQQRGDSNASRIEQIVVNPLLNTLLDNPEFRNPDSAPIPIDYRGSMTTIYKPYELIRTIKPYSNSPLTVKRENATLVTLVRNEELYDMLDSIYQLESRFNQKYQYDWVFLNDRPFTEEFIRLTSAMVSGTARYGVIPFEHWSYPDFVDINKAKQVRESRTFANVAYGTSESYRHMCRFNSLFFYKHPILDDYQYYWRVEPKVSYSCDILFDPFKFMVDEGKDYGFTISMTEFPKTIESLWATSLKYFRDEQVSSLLPVDNLLSFVSNDGGTNYNLCHFWSNFEIANLDFFRSELYENYANHLDRAGGFFYERWGDAPVHTIAVAYLMERSKVHLFQDISYRHTVAGSCPLDDKLREKANCVCNPVSDWTISSDSSCNKRFLDVTGQDKMVDFDKYVGIIQDENSLKEQMKNELLEKKRNSARLRAEERKRKADERRKKKVEEKAGAASIDDQKKQITERTKGRVRNGRG